jgi:S-(hydroxymethyl)glutathione dehydrogenase/alcohol dehydrogenase
MQFRAAVLHRTNEPLSVETVEMTGLKPTDVLVRMRASGLCHTDLEVIQGQLAYPLPIVLGHEGAGVVEAVGADVTLVRPGDHVVCSWNPTCGHCYYCDRGQPILCEPYSKHQPKGHLLDGGSRMTWAAGLHHFRRLLARRIHRRPERGDQCEEIPFDRACVGCGGGRRRCRPLAAPGRSTVAVLGCGAVKPTIRVPGCRKPSASSP